MQFFEHVPHILWHGLHDALKLLPFLFLTYLLMELLEHKAGERVESAIVKAGRAGPAVGALLGLIPQCGFSSALAGFYAGRLVTPGTLLAVFLATSDEMLPIFISAEGVSAGQILTVLGLKLAIALAVGFVADLLLQKHIQKPHLEELCEDSRCHCEKGILRSALYHTLQIFLFVLVINVILTGAFELIGEEAISQAINCVPILGVLISAVIGLIPNCAASVVIATLWTKGLITGGAMLAGLLTGAGTGLLVLFRTNKGWKENLQLLLVLLCCGLLFGCLLDLTGLAGLMNL